MLKRENAGTQGEGEDKIRQEKRGRKGRDRPTKNDKIFKETKKKADREEEQRKLLPDRD